MLVSEVLDRAQNELFHSGGLALPSWDKDSDGTDISTLTLNLTGRMDNVPANSIAEWDDTSMEMALVDEVASSIATLFNRGHLETTAAVHTAGTRVLFGNPFPKQILFNTLVSVIRSLRGYNIYNREVDTSATLATNQPVALDSTAWDTAGDIWWKSGLRWQKLRKGIEYEVLYDASPIEVQVWTGQTGASLRIPYKQEVSVPTALSDDLSTLNVPESLQPYLSLGVAANVLLGREIPQVHAEHIRSALQREGRPIGSHASIARALEAQFLNQLVLQRNRQLEKSPTAIT